MSFIDGQATSRSVTDTAISPFAEKDRAFREAMDAEARDAEHEDYRVGDQMAWELFELHERARKGKDQDGM